MNIRTSLYLLFASFSASAMLRATEPATFNIRGVTAGITSQVELEKNDRWGKQLSKTRKPDGSTWIEYRFWAWTKVTAVIRGGVVQTVDAIPPDRLSAEKLAEALNLGDLVSVKSRKSLGPAAFIGSSTSPDNWQVYRCSKAPGGLIFTEMNGKRRVVKLMRLYSLGLPKEITNSIGMKLKLIPAGEFIMGSPKDEAERDDNEHQHRVRITKPFYMGIYEVTQEQYEKIMGKNPSYFKGNNRPVENVTWYDAMKFCRRLSEKEGETYTLPTEAQWEYVCRAGTTTPFAFGNTLSSKTDANFDGDYTYGGSEKGPDRAETTPVGSYRANAWGFYDMHGNVNEYCADWYGKDYYDLSPVSDPKGPGSGEYRVRRGGHWRFRPGSARSAERKMQTPVNHNYLDGFRISRTP